MHRDKRILAFVPANSLNKNGGQKVVVFVKLTFKKFRRIK
jgi:hypothetical protein